MNILTFFIGCSGVPADIIELSDKTPTLDLKYLEQVSASEEELEWKEIAGKDGQADAISYQDLYLSRNTDVVSGIMDFDFTPAPTALNTSKARLLFLELKRNGEAGDQNWPFVKAATTMMPDKAISELEDYLVALWARPGFRIDPEIVQSMSSQELACAITCVSSLLDYKKFYESLDPGDPLKVYPVAAVVDNFIDQLNEGSFTIEAKQDSFDVETRAAFYPLNHKLVINDNGINPVVLLHESIHIWQLTAKPQQSMIDNEIEASLISIHFSDRMGLKEPQNAEGVASYEAEIVDSYYYHYSILTNAADRWPSLNEEQRYSFLSVLFAQKTMLLQHDSAEREEILTYCKKYDQEKDPQKKQESRQRFLQYLLTKEEEKKSFEELARETPVMYGDYDAATKLREREMKNVNTRILIETFNGIKESRAMTTERLKRNRDRAVSEIRQVQSSGKVPPAMLSEIGYKYELALLTGFLLKAAEMESAEETAILFDAYFAPLIRGEYDVVDISCEDALERLTDLGVI